MLFKGSLTNTYRRVLFLEAPTKNEKRARHFCQARVSRIAIALHPQMQVDLLPPRLLYLASQHAWASASAACPLSPTSPQITGCRLRAVPDIPAIYRAALFQVSLTPARCAPLFPGHMLGAMVRRFAN